MNLVHYTIKAVCNLTGLSESTLRAWEQRYGAVNPMRSESGRRVYSVGDVEKLQLLMRARDVGHSIGQIAKLESEEIKGILERFHRGSGEKREAQRTGGKRIANYTAFCRRILNAIAKYDLAFCHAEMLEMRKRMEIDTFILEVLVPLFYQLGGALERERCRLTQEHALSAMIKSILLSEFFEINPTWENAKFNKKNGIRRVSIATMDGDYHEFGILMSAVLFAHHGISVSYFGASVPSLQLANALTALKSDAVILSFPKVDTLAAKSFEAFVSELSAHLPGNCQLWVGGGDAEKLSRLVAKYKFRGIGAMSELNDILSS